LVQELHEAGSKATEAYASCSVIPEATDKRQFTNAMMLTVIDMSRRKQPAKKKEEPEEEEEEEKVEEKGEEE